MGFFLCYVAPAVNPEYAEGKQDVIRWLMHSNEDWPDDNTVLIQCQESPSKKFPTLASSAATQRDVTLFSIGDLCTDVGGDGDLLSILADPMTC